MNELDSLLDQNSYVRKTIRALLPCRNLLITMCQTIETLLLKGVCTDGFSIFINCQPRLVELVGIKLEMVAALTKKLNLIIGSLAYACIGDFSLLQNSSSERREALSSMAWLTGVLKGERFAAFDALDHTTTLSELEYCWSCLARVLDLGLISYCASHLVAAEEYYCVLGYTAPDGIIEIPGTNLVYSHGSLDCMGTLIQDCKVWTLSQKGFSSTHSAYVSTTISDLADLWGPIWKLEKTQAVDDSEKACFYALGSGAIGALSPSQQDFPVTLAPDEIICHFVNSRAQMEHTIKPLAGHIGSKLVIGASKPGKLEENASCKIPRQECFPGRDIRPHGTTLGSTYNSSTTLMFSAGYSGSQIEVSKQYQQRPSKTRKQILLEKWTLNPHKRNPNMLLLWCGLEVSLCTRNARRRRLIEILGSNTMLPHIDRIQWDNGECANAFKDAMTQDIDAFSRLYLEHQEWRQDLGLAIAQLLDILGSTGVASSGDLEVLTSTDSVDSDQILLLSPKRHTWVNILKDTAFSATFAVTTPLCLSFPYGHIQHSIQVCRGRRRTTGQFTVLETNIAPLYSHTGPKSKVWSENIPNGKKLPLQSSSTDMLKLVDYLPQNEMLATWSGSERIKAALLRFQFYTNDIRFGERVENSNHELSTGVDLFIMSEKHNDLPCTPKRSVSSLSSACVSRTSPPDCQDWSSESQTRSSLPDVSTESSDATMESSMTDPESPTPTTGPSTVVNYTPDTFWPLSFCDNDDPRIIKDACTYEPRKRPRFV